MSLCTQSADSRVHLESGGGYFQFEMSATLLFVPLKALPPQCLKEYSVFNESAVSDSEG